MLHARTRSLCRGANHAALTTLFADGGPQTQIMATFKNVARDPRVTVTIWDTDYPNETTSEREIVR